MSYLFDGEQMTTPVKKIRDHRGEKNPHYNHPMTQDSRNAIAASQRVRYDYYRKAAANVMTEQRVKEIIAETIQEYLAKNTTEIKNNRPNNNIPL